MRDPSERLLDILEAIENIEKYSSLGRGRFDDDELIQTWIVRNLQIIGEAASRIPDEIQILASEIPWDQIIGMRHIIVHDYFHIDADIVWQVVDKELTNLEKKIKALLKII